MKHDNFEDKIAKLKDEGKSVAGNCVFELILAGLILSLFGLSFGEIIVKQQSLWTFLGNTFVLFMFTVITRATYYKKGVIKGRAQDGFTSACVTHAELVSHMSGRQIEQLQTFLNAREERERRTKAEYLLKAVGLAVAHADSFAAMGKTERKKRYATAQIRALTRALKLPYRPLFSGMILSDNTGKLARRERWIGDNVLAARYNVTRAVTTFATTACFAYFAIDVFTNFSLAAFGWFLARVVFICSTALVSQLAGFSDVKTESMPTVQRKTAVLKEFLNWQPEAQEESAEQGERGAESALGTKTVQSADRADTATSITAIAALRGNDVHQLDTAHTKVL